MRLEHSSYKLTQDRKKCTIWFINKNYKIKVKDVYAMPLTKLTIKLDNRCKKGYKIIYTYQKPRNYNIDTDVISKNVENINFDINIDDIEEEIFTFMQSKLIDEVL